VVSRGRAIATLFTGERLEDILAALDAAGAAGGADAAFASAAAALIRTKSPTSLKIALAQMQRGSALDFAECMCTEFRIVSRVVRGHDFYEGVRAVIIDKDQAPHWQPPTLAAVSAAEVERHFAPLASELELP
jgi:enoyl-CoA hydratase